VDAHDARREEAVNRAAVALVVVVVAASAAPASADPQAEAVVLFDQGIKDMKAGRLDKACPELQASLDLVKDSGTKGALARCHGLAGRLATAWLLWRELADTAPTRDLRSDAAAQAAKLEPRLPRYTIRLARAVPRVTVQINGRSVATNVPVPVPIDPGKLSVSASGQDTEVWTRDYTAVEGQTLTIEIPELAPRVVAVKRPRPVERAPVEPAKPAGRGRRVVALVLGGVALGAAGGGTYFGLDARREYRAAERLCDGAIDQCPPDQVSASQRRVDDARVSATWSTAMVGAAGAVALTAIIVWSTAPSREDRSIAVVPSAGPGSIGVAVGGAF
jgi:hypothetical protein